MERFNDKWGVLITTVGFIFLVYVWFSHKAEKGSDHASVPSTPSADPPLTQSVDSSSRASIGDITINVPGFASGQKHETRSTDKRPSEKVTQVDLLEVEEHTVWINEGNVWKMNDSGWSERFSALLLPVYLDPVRSEPGAKLEHARAHIVFEEETSGRKIRVAHGCWIDAEYDAVHIQPGETKHLLLVVFDADRKKASALSTNFTSATSYEDHPDQESHTLLNLLRTRYRVNVTLMWSGYSHVTRTFDLILDLSPAGPKYHNPPRSESERNRSKFGLQVSKPEERTVTLHRLYWALSTDGPRGMVVWVHNKPPERGQRSEDVSTIFASVLFTEGDQELAHVSRACWLDEQTNRVDIRIGERKGILLGTFNPKNKLWRAYENERETPFQPTLRGTPIAKGPIDHAFYFKEQMKVEVAIVSASTGTTLKVMRIDIVSVADDKLAATLTEY